MTYDEAISVIHQTPWKSHEPTLERIRQLMRLMGDPQDKIRYVHIAGSNGKGSVAAITASVLQQAGYRVGLCTSPYIHRFNERMQINSVAISDEELAEITEKAFECSKMMTETPTEFEFVNAITFEFFARHNCDIAVVEVGLGGRLDATNIIKPPIAAVITAIGLEHTEFLGDTVEKIAAEKAGIIKTGCTAVIGVNPPNVKAVIEQRCRELNVESVQADESSLELIVTTKKGQKLRNKNGGEYMLPLLGEHQRQNLAAVLSTVNVLKKAGFSISTDALSEGIAKTRWIGRFELLRECPDFIVDGGHNPQCAQIVAQTLKSVYGEKKVIFLLGVLADKDICGIVEPVLPMAKAMFTITPPIPRAMESQQLSALLSEKYGVKSKHYTTISQGIEAALHSAAPDDVICAFGSLYSVGAIREFFVKA